MESERCKCEKMIRREMNWVNHKLDGLYWEIKSLQDIRNTQNTQTPPVNYLAVITRVDVIVGADIITVLHAE